MAKERKPISKKLRFEVFKRDNFTCQYCSAKPPKIPLEVDHIIPVFKNGTNIIDNLITACFDCNRGKGKNELSNVPKTLIEKSEIKRIAQEQYKQYKKLLDKEKKQIELEVRQVEEIFISFFPTYSFTLRFEISVKQFIKKIGLEDVEDAMERACLRVNHKANDAIKYFCGICWNKIRENE